MSVDLGTEFMKIGIVKPGIPMEIVLNKFGNNNSIKIPQIQSDNLKNLTQRKQTKNAIGRFITWN